MEYAAGEIDMELVLPLFLYEGWVNGFSATERYRSRGTPGLGRLKTGGVAMVFLKARKACSQVSSHEKGSIFLSNL